ncbi:hypothetical protein EEDFHM_00028 [Methylorubrum populi]
MALFGPSTATATVAANTNAVTVTGMDLTVVTPGMTISLGARDRKKGDAWIIGAVAANGTNGGTLTLAGSVPDASTNVPFVIDTTGYLGTDASYAAAIGLAILSTLATLFGVATNLYSGARQLVLDKVSGSTVGRIAFAIAGRSWGDIAHRTLTYTPTGGQAASTETLALRAFPDGTTPTDALVIDLSAGTGDLRQGTATMASATTVDLGSAPAGKVTITGAASITSFGPGKNLVRLLRFAGGATLKHSAGSLSLPGGADITTAGGDTALATSDASGNWVVSHYQRADGRAVFAPQIMTGNSGPTTINGGQTLYFTNALVGANAFNVYCLAGRRVRIRNLRIVTPDQPGSGQSYKFTLMKLFTETALSCTITAGNQASDTTNTVDFLATDRWSIKIVTSSSAAGISFVLFAMDFEVLE